MRTVAATGTLVAAFLITGALAGAVGDATPSPVVNAAEQGCRFEVFQELRPPEVRHTCSPGHGQHRALAVCDYEATGEAITVRGPLVAGPETSVASCGVGAYLVDWGAEGGG